MQKSEKQNNVAMENFFLMGENERAKVEKWFNLKKTQKILECGDTTTEQFQFLRTVEKALERIDYDYQIPIIEPSKTEDGKLFYQKGCKVPVGVADSLTASEWDKAATEFYYDGKWRSEIASIYELYLWYAYRIAMRYWTLEYVCDDSRGEGNYDNDAGFEKSGAREVGGFADGIGNSFKLVKLNSEIVAIGGSNFTSGIVYPVAHIDDEPEDYIFVEAVAVVVLKSLE